MAKHKKITGEEFLKAFTLHGGNIKFTAEMLGVSNFKVATLMNDFLKPSEIATIRASRLRVVR